MAIGFTQSVGFSNGNTNGITSSLTGVASGSLLVQTAAVFVSGGPANVTPTDDKSNDWNTTTAPTERDQTNSFINYAMDSAAGDTVLTIDYGSAFAVEGEFCEFSGLETTSALDVEDENDSASDSTPDVASAASTAQADELVVVVMAIGTIVADAGIDTPATTGYTNLHVQQNNSTNAASASDYKIVAATGTQSAAWGTLGGAHSWTAKLVTFKQAGGGGGAGTTSNVRVG